MLSWQSELSGAQIESFPFASDCLSDFPFIWVYNQRFSMWHIKPPSTSFSWLCITSYLPHHLPSSHYQTLCGSHNKPWSPHSTLTHSSPRLDGPHPHDPHHTFELRFSLLWDTSFKSLLHPPLGALPSSELPLLYYQDTLDCIKIACSLTPLLH